MKIFQKEEADILLKDQDFLKAWDQILMRCPWSTVFQSKEFVLSWFHFFNYCPPIIVTDWNGRDLTGLLTLTIEDEWTITAAGTNQAEYQTWMALKSDNNAFIKEALSLLSQTFPKYRLKLKYLPPFTPVKWLKESSDWNNRILLHRCQQPLIAANQELLLQKLRKKNRKEKINRLRKKGILEFKLISSIEEFKEIIDEMAVQSDFRKGAKYDKVAFITEPHRKDFLIRLFELRLLHVSVLKLNEEIIASNAGVFGFDMVHLQGINSHSPFYSKYSPGILHFLMLGLDLEKAGAKYFDLTPGGAEGYKGMLATEYRDAYEFTLVRSWEKPIQNQKISLKLHCRRIIERLPVFEGRKSDLGLGINNFIKKSKLYLSHGVKALEVEALHKVFSRYSKLYYLIGSNFHTHAPLTSPSGKNKLEDLLAFEEKNGVITRWEFLSDCMRRIELGHQVFTFRNDEFLVAVFWYIPTSVRSGETMDSGEVKFDFPTLATSYYLPEFCPDLIEMVYTLRNQIFESEKILAPIQFQISHSQKVLMKDWNFFHRQSESFLYRHSATNA